MKSSMHLAWCDVKYGETILQGSTTRRKEKWEGKGKNSQVIIQEHMEREHEALLTKFDVKYVIWKENTTRR
jgi:hypothetical protein